DAETTLSVVDLRKVANLASAVSKLSGLLFSDLEKHRPAVATARAACQRYAPGYSFHHVDLQRFTEQLASATPDPDVRAAAASVAALVKDAQVAPPYAGTGRQGRYGSGGLAIYFPETLADYRTDGYRGAGYIKANTFYPVAFVADARQKWPDFLHAYLRTGDGPSPTAASVVKAKGVKAAETPAATAPAARGKALVIGNANYGSPALNRPVCANDAGGMGAALSGLGFDSTLRLDLGRAAFLEELRRFHDSLGPTEPAFVYYSGHGLQFEGESYLVPVDAAFARPADLPAVAVSLTTVLGALDASREAPRFVVLDACRSNPWESATVQWIPGLAAPPRPKDDLAETLISYSTSPNRVARDDASDDVDGLKRSAFTRALRRYISLPGLTVEDLFKAVRVEVQSGSAGLQSPTEWTWLRNRFCFREGVWVTAALEQGDDEVFLLHDGSEVASYGRTRGRPVRLPLHVGRNVLTVRVFNQKTCVGGRPCHAPPVPLFFGAPEGWRYALTLRDEEGHVLLHVDEAREDIPTKDGPHHGKTFDASRIVLDVDDRGVVSLPEKDLDLWKRG
ncbi:MAG TPA: caspase family protein, partial [Thermoanaerobaculia bacterium]|nr:caspase family protein [Thermoanaerobaculia bacterium]